MGFGQRLHKNFDPRANILAQQAEKLFAAMDRKDPLLDVARKLAQIALSDPNIIERKLYPNVDFYRGIIPRALDIPTDMFTVLFTIGRMPGWITHRWKKTRYRAAGFHAPARFILAIYYRITCPWSSVEKGCQRSGRHIVRLISEALGILSGSPARQSRYWVVA